ncbi:MAG TPA: D-glycerate dehydrogenase [Pseudolysinimonas sp.]|nr:D-glycerate dehydrogenase [Pseudolysinimonas sp.]
MSRPIVFNSTHVPADLIADLEKDFEVIEVPEGTTDFSSYPSPVGWIMDGATPVDAAALAQLPELKVVSNYGVGYDSLVAADLKAAGVIATNTPGVLDNAVAELTLGLIIAMGRGIVGFDAYTRDGRWIKDEGDAPLTRDVHGSTVGIVGLGRIGSRLAQLLKPLNVNVIYHNRNKRPESETAGLAEWREWEDLLAESDFVVLQVPLTERTRGFFIAEDFAMMKDTAYLINMARGAVVNTGDLIEAVKTKKIAGAALDVFEQEPLPLDHPLVELEGVVLLPHIGSATVETRRDMIELAVRNLRNGVLGQPVETPIDLG